MLIGCGNEPVHRRPNKVPKDAFWVGGFDGGNWYLTENLNPHNKTVHFKIYNDYNGNLDVEGVFILHCDSKTEIKWENLIEEINLFDGEVITLKNHNKNEQNCYFKPVTNCDSCYLDKLIIEPVNNEALTKTIISESTAITFFHLYEQITKYDRSGYSDSLPQKLKINDHRQTIYRIAEQRRTYDFKIQPILDSLNVKIIKGDFKDRLLTFKFQKKTYKVDINSFEENDGVIFFTPGKKPILWTANRTNINCNKSELVECYFNSQK